MGPNYVSYPPSHKTTYLPAGLHFIIANMDSKPLPMVALLKPLLSLRGIKDNRAHILKMEPQNSNRPVFLVAVGMPVARHPPHRSQRALLTHWAPTSGVNVHAQVRITMTDAGLWKPAFD